ncbi:ATP-binding protein [Methanothermobacter sp. EMTCatA1]|uniref:ATP-binding protein n=1 Tax=Methanothermobacter sp. EMTCatA1 TaxID=2017966 RepID=UPI000B5F9988|nr:ATP-binding protein [Methanothermobacter sp. EMTCatA1]BAZ98365.1 hypothetical protein tca_00290 [Methanothermobacter sp. EMTCatA1]
MNDPPLIENYVTYSEIRSRVNDNRMLDLRQYSWFYPTTLLPLFHLKKTKSLRCELHPGVKHYFEVMEQGNPGKGKTYIPFVELLHDRSERDPLKYVYDLLDKSYGGKDALCFLLSELSDNIYQHSKFTSAYILAQKYPKKGFIEICFLDDGVSIPQNFENHDYYFEYDSEAIIQAINGKSTKVPYPGDPERGYGLNNILKIFVEGGKGELLVVSRRGAFYKSQDAKMYELGNEFQGTLVSLRIHKGKLNIYKYI